MKALFSLVGRMGVILLAAFLVIGVTLSLVDSNTTAPFPAGSHEDRMQSSEEINTTAGTTRNVPNREFHDPGDQSLASRLAFGLFGLLQNFVIIGVIVLVAVWVERRFTRRQVKMSV